MAFLDDVMPSRLVERLKPWLAGRHRLFLMGAGAAALSAAFLVFFWNGGGGYAPLFAGLGPAEGGRAIAELGKLNIPYRVSDGGRIIEVPDTKIGEARLALAMNGVPHKGGDDWSVLDHEALGVSPFVEQVHYLRGLEGALSRTVGQVDGVVSSQITLAVPKRTAFLESQPKPSASVLLRLAPGVELSRRRVDGIVGLVASGVPGLAREAVTVVDQTGKVLNSPHSKGLDEVPEQLAIVRQVEERYREAVAGVVAPIVGKANVSVAVDADVDFTARASNSVTFGPSHVLSEDKTKEARAGDEIPAGIPGALSNQPPGTPTAPFDAKAGGNRQASAPERPRSSKERSVVNYDLDKTVEEAKSAPWLVKRVSVAVLVRNASGKPLPGDRVASIKSVAEAAIGSGADRKVTVVDVPLESGGAPLEAARPWWKESWAIAAAENAVWIILGLMALLGVLLPASRWIGARRVAQRRPGDADAAGRTVELARFGLAVDRRKPAGAAAAAGVEPSLDSSKAGPGVFEVDMEVVKDVVRRDPAKTGLVIKEWLKSDVGRTKAA